MSTKSALPHPDDSRVIFERSENGIATLTIDSVGFSNSITRSSTSASSISSRPKQRVRRR